MGAGRDMAQEVFLPGSAGPATLLAMSPRLRHLVALIPALTLFAGCDDSGSDDHGTIKIQMNVNDTSTNVFAGTKRVVVRVKYGESCLKSFYKETKPSWAALGTDGAPVFEEWSSRLCDSGEFSSVPDCEVMNIQQIEDPNNGNLSLQVEYKINDPDIYLKEFRVGPIPTEALAGCHPKIIVNDSSVQGFSETSGGAQEWRVASYNPGVTATNEGASVVVTVISTGSNGN